MKRILITSHSDNVDACNNCDYCKQLDKSNKRTICRINDFAIIDTTTKPVWCPYTPCASDILHKRLRTAGWWPDHVLDIFEEELGAFYVHQLLQYTYDDLIAVEGIDQNTIISIIDYFRIQNIYGISPLRLQ